MNNKLTYLNPFKNHKITTPYPPYSTLQHLNIYKHNTSTDMTAAVV